MVLWRLESATLLCEVVSHAVVIRVSVWEGKGVHVAADAQPPCNAVPPLSRLLLIPNFTVTQHGFV